MSHYAHRVACGFVEYCYQRYYNTIECSSPELLRDGSLQDYDSLVRVNPNLVWTISAMDLNKVKRLADNTNSRRFLLDVEMYRMGDMYDVPSLKKQAAHRLEWRLYEYSCARGSPGPILGLIAPVYEYTGSDRNILRRLLFRGLKSFRKSIWQHEASRSTLKTLKATVHGFDKAYRRIFSGSSANLRDEPFGWPSTAQLH